MSALLLAALLLLAAQGSVAVLAHQPVTGPAASWTTQCRGGQARQDRRRIAYCARVEGRVVASTHGPSADESHIAVISNFHVTLVLVPNGAPTPSWGSHVVAVGPLVRSRSGQREVEAYSLEPR